MAFLDYLESNFFLKYEEEEVKCIQSAVYTFIERIVAKIDQLSKGKKVKISKNAKQKIIPTGSMAEHTKVWPLREAKDDPELEFDYLVVVDPSYQEQACIPSPSSCKGFMNMRFKDNQECDLLTSDLTAAFGDMLHEALVDICKGGAQDTKSQVFHTQEWDDRTDTITKGIVKEVFCHDKDHTGHKEGTCCVKKDYGRLQFTSYTTHGYHELHFKWVSDGHTLCIPYVNNANQISNSPASDIRVDVDILPGFEILSDNGKLKGHLVAKRCNIKDHTMCWKISHCVREIELLKSSELHRAVYMSLKFLCQLILYPDDTAEWKNLPDLPSYKLKTAVLNHMMNCESGSSECLVKTLRYFADCVKDEMIPHWLEDYTLNIDFTNNERGSVFLLCLCDMLEMKKLDPNNSYCIKSKKPGESVPIHHICGNELSDILKQISEDQYSPSFLQSIRNAAVKLFDYEKESFKKYDNGFEVL